MRNGAVQDIIIQRTAPMDTLSCPRCMNLIAVERDERTNMHRLVVHACASAGTPVAFIPGKYAVVAVIWNNEGKILAVSRKDNPDDFGLPGGKADPIPTEDGSTVYEDPMTALRREVREETGLEIKRARYVYWRKDYTKLGDPRPTIPALCFLVEAYEGTPIQGEAGRVQWVEPAVVASKRASFHDYNRGLFDALFIDYDTGEPEEPLTPELFLRWVDECDGFEVPMDDERIAPLALGLAEEGKIALGPARGPDNNWRRATRPDAAE